MKFFGRLVACLIATICLFAAMTMVVVAKPAPLAKPAPARPTATNDLNKVSVMTAVADEKADSAKQGVALLWQAKTNLEAMVHLMAADQVKVGRKLRALTAMRKWERELPAGVKAQVGAQINTALEGLARGTDVDAAIKSVEDALTKRITELESRVTNMETAVNRMDARVSVAENVVEEIKGRTGANLSLGVGGLSTTDGAGGFAFAEVALPAASSGWTIRGMGLAGGTSEDAFLWGAGFSASRAVTDWCELGLGLSSTVVDKSGDPGITGAVATVDGEVRFHLWQVDLIGRGGVGPHMDGDPVDIGYTVTGALGLRLF